MLLQFNNGYLMYIKRKFFESIILLAKSSNKVKNEHEIMHKAIVM